MTISPNQLNAQFDNVKKLCGTDLILTAGVVLPMVAGK